MEDNKTLRDFISVYDVAKANYIVLQNPEADYQVFNVSGDKHYTANELALCLSKKMKIKLEFSTKIEFRPGDIRNALSDSSKLKELGWKQSVSEEETLEHLCELVEESKN